MTAPFIFIATNRLKPGKLEEESVCPLSVKANHLGGFTTGTRSAASAT